ncbi:CRISPR-associated helicase/endonuclease Cas3 [Nocardiopsis halophila]|uniref:CRISPR-associated helicase/endonuclease Cas3 n=1 Tax=Nocardiopsis halophila TaxID=141692 RepID=UPI000380F4D0|nr:CRISPR-associated helicase/endonuclease Cas3 [Nocardiopsis halophila]
MAASDDDLLLTPWAKSSKEGVHPLICHLIDTMEVSRLLYGLFLGPKVREELERVFSPLAGSAEQWVSLLCGLHDLGKYSPAFQSLVLEVAQKRFPESEHRLLEVCAPARKLANLDTKHGLTTGVHLDGMLHELGVHTSDRIVLSQVLAGHHGYIPSAGEIRSLSRPRGGRHKKDIGDGQWRQGRSAMVRRVAALGGLDFGDARWPEVRVPSQMGLVGLAGLTTISDWVASDTRFFPYEEEPESLEAYRIRAAERAQEALRSVGWRAWTPGERTGFTQIFGDGSPPFPLQRRVEEAVESCEEPGVLVIEAPTGEGKTKAGLQAAARLVHRLGLGGLYYSTPTKELSRQAYDDVQDLLKGTGSDLEVNLVYSGAAKEQKQARKDEAAGSSATITPSGVGAEDDAGTEEGSQDPWEWFTRKKGLAFPIGVGTVDQAVKAVIRGGHNFLGMAALSNKVVVIDEVHAYDSYTGRIIKQLLWFCGRLGAPVVLMSATLPADQRAELIEHWHAGAESRPVDPEAASVTSPGTWNVQWSPDPAGAFEVDPSSFARDRGPVQVEHLGDAPSEIAARVADLVGEAGTALVVLNTKDRAKRVRDELRARLADVANPPAVVHFDGEHQGAERREIKRHIDAHIGKTSPESRHAVVVGTQVLEHGMDLDADVLVSDLCPIDLLFQRAGRLHRHDRRGRPSHLARPTLYVADVDPAERAARPPSKRTSLVFTAHVTTVYRPWILGRTRMLLQQVLRAGEWDPMSEIGKQIHRLYVSSESLVEEGWERAWHVAQQRHEQALEREEADGREVLVPMLGEAAMIDRLTMRRAPAGRTRRSSGPDRFTESRGR